jgi:hypothetical protein
LPQEFKAAWLFTQVIADKFLQEIRAFFQDRLGKFNSGGLGQFAAFNPQQLFYRSFGKRHPGCRAAAALATNNPATLKVNGNMIIFNILQFPQAQNAVA